MRGRIVIVAYRPKPGKQRVLAELVGRHVSVLRERGLAGERPAIAMQAADGALVEVFEWASADAIRRAHEDPVVQALWAEFAEACDYVPIGDLVEAAQLFSEFAPLVGGRGAP